jgi:hypothetical protein
VPLSFLLRFGNRNLANWHDSEKAIVNAYLSKRMFKAMISRYVKSSLTVTTQGVWKMFDDV